MLKPSVIIVAFSLLALNLVAQDTKGLKNASIFCPWKCNLKSRIKNKPLVTIEGEVLLPSVDVLYPCPKVNSRDSKFRDSKKMFGCLYTFQIQAIYLGSTNVSCINTPVNDSYSSKTIQIITTKLIRYISNGDCIAVTGAFDNLGNFICRKIYDKQTNSYVLDW